MGRLHVARIRARHTALLLIASMSLAALGGCASAPTERAITVTGSDREQILQLIDIWRNGLLAQDVEQILAVCSDDYYSDEVASKKRLRRYLQNIFQKGYLDAATISLDNMQLTLQDRLAVAQNIRYEGPAGELMLTITFRREGRAWRIIDMKA